MNKRKSIHSYLYYLENKESIIQEQFHAFKRRSPQDSILSPWSILTSTQTSPTTPFLGSSDNRIFAFVKSEQDRSKLRSGARWKTGLLELKRYEQRGGQKRHCG